MTGLSVVKSESKSRSESPCGCSVSGMSRNRSTTLTKRIFRSGKLLPQDRDRGQRLHGWMSPALAITTSGSAPCVVAGPVPDADSFGAVVDGRFHVEILQMRLLVGHDDVDVIAAAQAMIRHAQQTVGIGRKIDAHNVRALVGDDIEKARVLMSKAVVILPPDQRSDQQVDRGNWARASPASSFDFSSHLACWLNIESMMWTNAS